MEKRCHKAWNWEKYVAQHVKYYIILGNLIEYGSQGLDPESKVRYLLNGIRCDKLSTAVATVRAHPNKYEKDFDFIQYIDKTLPTPSVKVASVAHNRPAKWQKTNAGHGTFEETIKLKKYSREEYDSMSMIQHQQLYKLWKKAGFVKGKKTPESGRTLEARVAMLEAKTDNSNDDSLFPDEKPKATNRNNLTLDRTGNHTRQSSVDA